MTATPSAASGQEHKGPPVPRVHVSRKALLCRLLTYLPDAGFAADPVGILAVVGSDVAWELVPSGGAEGWVRRLQEAGAIDGEVVRSWERQANGIAWAIGITEVSLDGSAGELRALVSTSFEELLAERTLMREERP